MHVLAGDIGGTKTSLAIYSLDPAPRLVRSARFPSQGPGLLPIVLQFLSSGAERLQAAGFAVAGPVVDGRCKTTNLPWELDAAELSAALAVPTALVNDFHGVALGVGTLPDDQLDFYNRSAADRDPHGVVAVIGAGTGLGEALLVPTAAGPRVLASEGGHCDFAPRDDLEIDLLRHLLGRHARVSYERVVSGPGLVALYEFLIARGHASEQASTRARMAHEAPAAVIGELGVAGDDPTCARAVDLFAGLYGAEAGNLALKSLPTGGLYIAGGVGLHLRARLRERFLAGFLAKGRMSPLLHTIPVALVLDGEVGRRGAAAAAAALLA
jgi:glucokinase